MEGLSRSKANLTVYIHPSKANDVRQAILRQLSSLLFKYDEIFEGVTLAYEVHIPGRTGKILPGLIPYFGVKVEANLLLFSPKPNMLLEGKVVKLGKESIHAIVLGFSSAAIMSEDIRKEFKYKLKDGREVYSSRYHKRHVIKAGSIIRFLVKSFDEGSLHFSGSLVESNTGCIKWLSKHGAEDETVPHAPTDRNQKRKKMRDAKKEMLTEDAILPIEDDRSVNPSRPHKSRKRTSVE